MSEQQPDNNETLLEFPCDFAIKAMGETGPEFEQVVLDIVRRHASEILEGGLTVRQSSGGKYTSVTITIRAYSKPQIDAIYQDLTDHELVKFAL